MSETHRSDHIMLLKDAFSIWEDHYLNSASFDSLRNVNKMRFWQRYLPLLCSFFLVHFNETITQCTNIMWQIFSFSQITLSNDGFFIPCFTHCPIRTGFHSIFPNLLNISHFALNHYNISTVNIMFSVKYVTINWWIFITKFYMFMGPFQRLLFDPVTVGKYITMVKLYNCQ